MLMRMSEALEAREAAQREIAWRASELRANKLRASVCGHTVQRGAQLHAPLQYTTCTHSWHARVRIMLFGPFCARL